MIVPILGTKQKRSLADALFTRTQQRVLGLLFGQPHRSFYTSEIIRLSKAGSGATQRELAKLDEAGLVEVVQIGNQLNYSANRHSPIFEELSAIITKTVGLAEPLRESLAPMQSRIRAAFVFGSVAKRSDKTSSDIDLFVVSDEVTYAEMFGALERVSVRLGRAVNPTLVTLKQLRNQVAETNSFVTRILKQPKIWILGAEEDLGV